MITKASIKPSMRVKRRQKRAKLEKAGGLSQAGPSDTQKPAPEGVVLDADDD